MKHKVTFTKDKIEKIVDFMNEERYKLIFYKFNKISDDLYSIEFFGLHKQDREHLELIFQVFE